jgi:hypothetical protein
MVGILFLLVIIGNNQTIYEKNPPSLLIIPDLIFAVREGTKDGMDYRLLERSYQLRILQLDKKRTYKHLVEFCSC